MGSSGKKVVATNRQARREFEIIDTIEAGLVLQGSEVKSLRNAKSQIAEAYARIHDGEIWLNSFHISKYQHSGSAFSHEPDRPKKLLLHKKEINKLIGKTQEKGCTLVPLKVYFKNGKAKVDLGIAKAKKLYDKRATLKKQESDREIDRAMKSNNRG